MIDLIYVETYILYQTDRGEAGVEEAISSSARHTAAAVYCEALTFPAARFAWFTLAANDAIEAEWVRKVGSLLSLIGVFVNIVMYAFLIGWGWNALRGGLLSGRERRLANPSE
jgi:hypothetical protein